MDQTNSRTEREVKLRAGLTDKDVELTDMDVELMRLAVASGDVGAGNIIAGYAVEHAPPARVLRAMLIEFSRNGRQMLTPGKIRWLRRRARRGR